MSKKKKKKSNQSNSTNKNININIVNEDENITDTNKDNTKEISDIDKKIQEEIIAKKIEKDNLAEAKRKEELDTREKIYFNTAEMPKVNNTSAQRKNVMKKKHPIVNLFLMILAIASIGYFFSCLFIGVGDNALQTLIESLLLVLFTLMFVGISYTFNRNNKNSIFIGSLLLIAFYVIQIGTITGFITMPSFKQVNDFTGKGLTDVVSWASKNNIDVVQDYEYSDMISEYSIISQDVKAGTKVKDINSITVAVSEGPNPNKELIVSDMVGWDTERVLKYVKDNYLTNVDVEFVESEKAQDTVIEQSKSGNLKRNDEIKLTFSLGEEFDNSDVKLIDFKGMSKFEVTFYLKQHRIRYDYEDKFSSKIKKGYAVSQSKNAGEKVKVDDEKIKVYFSKGPKIKVPDLKSMSLTDITKWIINNKLKLEFTSKYDESAKENQILEVNKNKGDIVEQGSTIKLVISKGKLKMPKFKSYDKFREWADKYNVNYEEKHEFNNDIAIGEVIGYSYKTGEVIKNNDAIIVTISDGKKLEVPNLKGLSKADAISKLKDVGLEYNFVTKSSDDVASGKVISQSISAGSEVSSGTTITVTISSGKSTNNREDSGSSSNNNSNSSTSSNNNSSSNNSSSNSTGGNTATNTCTEKTYTVGRGLNNVFSSYSGYSSVSSALYSYFSSNYPDVKLSVVGVDGGDAVSGSYIGGIGPGSSITSCNGVTYTIQIAK